jgi:hypothetical protein
MAFVRSKAGASRRLRISYQLLFAATFSTAFFIA